jgi:hypothetical protein
MKKLKITLFLLIGINACIFSQNIDTSDNFKPSGKPFAKIFTNFHSNFSDDGNTSAFEITRAYFGYKYNLSKNFFAKINLEVGNPKSGDFIQIAYLKYAMVSYKTDKFLIDFGLIGLYQFQIQEKFWGHRYIYKSFQDAYKFGSSADLGISITYKPHKIISLDVTVINGEGYKKIQANETYKVCFGLTLKPAKGLIVRGYYDLMKDSVAQSTISAFIGYSTKKFSVGAEYNLQENHNMIKDQNYSGVSVYSSYQINNKFEVFGRYDNLSSVKIDGADEDWNIAKDGQIIIAGLEYSPIKYLKISSNFQGWQPAESGKSFVYGAYLNLEINF